MFYFSQSSKTLSFPLPTYFHRKLLFLFCNCTSVRVCVCVCVCVYWAHKGKHRNARWRSQLLEIFRVCFYFFSDTFFFFFFFSYQNGVVIQFNCQWSGHCAGVVVFFFPLTFPKVWGKHWDKYLCYTIEKRENINFSSFSSLSQPVSYIAITDVCMYWHVGCADILII